AWIGGVVWRFWVDRVVLAWRHMVNDTNPPGTDRERTNRCPCVPTATALAAGIAIDHLLPLPRLVVFAAAITAFAALVAGRRRRRGRNVILLLVLYVLIGAASHGAAWRD